MRKVIRRLVAAFFVILMLVSLFPFQVFAVDPVSTFATGKVVEFTEAAKLGATIIDLYGMANNTNLAYDVASSGSALTVIETLYQDYSSSASDPYTLAAIGAAAAAAGAVAVIYDAVTGQGYIQLFQEQYVSSMDGYWDYQLTDAGLVRDSVTGLFNWTLNQEDTVTPVQVYFQGIFPSIPLTANNHNAIVNNGLVFFVNSGTSFYIASEINDYYACYVDVGNDVIRVYYLTESSKGNCYSTLSNSNSTSLLYNNWVTNNPITIYGGYYGNINFDVGTTINPNIPRFANFTEAANAFASRNSNGETVNIEPYNYNYIGDPLDQPLEITIPDNTAPDYVPVPRRITTTMPVPDGIEIPLPDGVTTPEYGVPYPVNDPETLNELVPEIWDDLVVGNIGLRDAPEPMNPETPSIDEVIGGPDDYQVPGLADVFPFCIPFDIYHFLQALAADPTPPHFTAQLAFPEAIGGTQEIDIDFDSPTWNQLAQLLRLLELLLFIIGLAFVTRSMFIRG